MQKMQNINRKKREETEKSRWSFFLFLKKRNKLKDLDEVFFEKEKENKHA